MRDTGAKVQPSQEVGDRDTEKEGQPCTETERSRQEGLCDREDRKQDRVLGPFLHSV